MTSLGMKLFENRLIQSLSINILKCGQIPRHVAFVMDGNRRHARKNNIPFCDTHKLGYRKYEDVIDWCISFGIQEVSIFFLSINNFCKRSKEEVDCLMIEIKNAFERMIENAKSYKKKGIQVRIIGNLEYLPKVLQDVIAKVVILTKDNRGFRFSIAIAYSGMDEIAQATANIVSGLQDGDLSPKDVTPGLLNAAMLTGDSLPPDIVIRTSGEVRISDYLLWQSSHSMLHFIPVLWPDLSFWNIVEAIFQFQTSEIKKKSGVPLTKQAKAFLRELYEKREAKMLQLGKK